jgi:hypothetical protein
MSEVSGLAAGAWGTLIGAALTSSGFILKRKLEQLSTLKLVLFQLLEIHHSTHRATNFNMQEYIETYRNAVIEVFPDEDMNNFDKNIAPNITSLLRPIFSSMLQGNTESLLKSYDTAIEQLASITPFLAYKMSGNSKVKEILASIDNYFDNIPNLIGIDTAAAESPTISFVTTHIKGVVAKEILLDIEADISSIALSCGPVTFWRFCKWKDQRNNNGNNFKLEMKEKIVVLLSETKKHMQQKLAESQQVQQA